MKLLSVVVLVLALVGQSYQDVFMHNPRGSNNRLNETSANRQDNNRAFDSQNNNRGGYNVGDDGNDAYDSEAEQYQMKYFQSGVRGSSFLNVEYTSQHGCGVGANCNLVIQYLCQPTGDFEQGDLDRVRDGLVARRQNYEARGNNDTLAGYLQRKANSVSIERVLHESWESYDNCVYRNRNLNLFTADQNLRNNNRGYSSAIFTRQNANGGRSGYECPEERDYYPYWHPNGGWNDAAVLTSNVSECANIRAESSNVRAKNLCIEFYSNGVQKHWSRWNNQTDCQRANGTWASLFNYLEKAPRFTTQATCEANQGYRWGIPFDSKNISRLECLVLAPAVDCRQADSSRENHLGNTVNTRPATYQWRLPNFPSNRAQTCVLRLRYNITSNDYAPNVDSRSNNNRAVISNNPTVKVGLVTLKLALNTAQVGRTFQDRSHTFLLLPRPSDILDTETVYNLNVRGKRGNIVQTFPAVEYDFVPNDLRVNAGDVVHIQWTGSNTHNNNGAGDAGEGRTGTDRSNFVLMSDFARNYPIQFENSTFLNDIDFIGFLSRDISYGDNSTQYLRRISASQSADPKQDLALYLTSASNFECVSNRTCTRSFDRANLQVDDKLNSAPASLPGAVIRLKRSKVSYTYVSLRNNNFSNRRQSGTLTVN